MTSFRNLSPLPVLLAFCAALILPTAATQATAQVQTDAARGLEIATEADKRDRGFKDSESEITMVLRTANGQEGRRVLRIRILEDENPEGGDKSLVIFDAPRDIAGTALLSFARGIEPDDQWLYLPKVGRVKRISGSNRSGPFMGSEYAYEDLAAPELVKYSYVYLGDERCGELTCYKIERRPRYKDSGYSRQIVWLDTEHYRPMKVEFYDRRDTHLKTLNYSEYRLYGRYWRAHNMEMVNHRTGKSTSLLISGYRFGSGFSEADFSTNALKRIR